MASSIGARTALMRALCRKTSTTAAGAGTSSTATLTFRSRVSASAASVRSGCAHRHPPASTSSRFLRRELSSLLPLHSAIASARLISKLPDDAVSVEGAMIRAAASTVAFLGPTMDCPSWTMMDVLCRTCTASPIPKQ